MPEQQRTALITGGGRGIGRAVALRLARDGADVVLAGPDPGELQETAAEVEALHRQALPVVADVSRDEDVGRLVEQARDRFGRIDILVNNAAVIGPTAPVHEIPRNEWDDTLSVNLTGAFLCAKAVIPGMIEQRSGCIINVASIAGKTAYALRSPYAVSKWGLIGLTLTMAKELGPYNIRVNAVCPGPVEGDRMRRVFEQRAAELNRPIEEIRREYVDKTLLGRLVQEEDVAAAAAFLVSEAGRNVTGQTIDVTAGYGI